MIMYGVIEAVKWARQAGFDNLSLDLIYGLPGSELWNAGSFHSRRPIQLAPEHLSLYSLTLDEGYAAAPLGQPRAWSIGRTMILMADMYLWAMDSAGRCRIPISMRLPTLPGESPNGAGETPGVPT